MYVVLCKNGCGSYIPCGPKPTLKSCGKPYCAYNAWLLTAERYGYVDFFV